MKLAELLGEAKKSNRKLEPKAQKVPAPINSVWDVEYTDEFNEWWSALSEKEQESINASVELLETDGANLKHPFSSGINRSKHSHMRELRIHAHTMFFTHSIHFETLFC